MRSLLIESCRQSPTLRQLTDAIGRTDGVVYIITGPCLVRSLRGCLLHTIVDTGNARYLWIRVNANADSRELIATIAHELQHAFEVLSQTGIRSTSELLGFYRSVDARSDGCRRSRMTRRVSGANAAYDGGHGAAFGGRLR